MYVVNQQMQIDLQCCYFICAYIDLNFILLRQYKPIYYDLRESLRLS